MHLSTGTRLVLAILTPPILVFLMSPVAYAVLPASPDIPELARVFSPAFAAAAIYGAALFERERRRRLAVFALAAIVLFAFRRVSAGHLFVWENWSRSQELQREMETLVQRVHLTGVILAGATAASAVLRAFRVRLRLAPDLVVLLASGVWLFLPRPWPATLPPSSLRKVFSPELHGEDLYFWAYVEEAATRYHADDSVPHLLRLRAGETSAECLWPNSSGFKGKRESGGPRFVVQEHRWWYLLFGSASAYRIVDAGTGERETIFRDRLSAIRGRSQDFPWPRVVLAGPKKAWVFASVKGIEGRMETGRHFSIAEDSSSQMLWFQNGKLEAYLLESHEQRAALISVDMKTGRVGRSTLPSGRVMSSPSGDRSLVSESVRHDDVQKNVRWLRRLFFVDDQNLLELIDGWRQAEETGIVLWPRSGKPRVATPAWILGSWPRFDACQEIDGHCLAVEPVGNNPSPGRFPELYRVDLEAGKHEPLASFTGAIQWLDDSVVLAEVVLRTDAVGATRARQRIIRYFPKDGRREILLALPNDMPLIGP